MIALSVRQPWSHFIVAGVPINGEPPIFKDVENREWKTPFRGRCLIHASKGGTRREFDAAIAGVEDTFGIVIPLGFDDFARGGIVGSVEIFDCVAESTSDWFTGPFGFLLREPRELPFRAERGRLSFFNTEDHPE